MPTPDAEEFARTVLWPRRRDHTAGIATDKLIALSDTGSQTIRHLHFVDLTDDDLIAFAVKRSHQLASEKRAQAAVVEVPALPAAEQAPSANTRNRKPRKH